MVYKAKNAEEASKILRGFRFSDGENVYLRGVKVRGDSRVIYREIRPDQKLRVTMKISHSTDYKPENAIFTHLDNEKSYQRIADKNRTMLSMVLAPCSTEITTTDILAQSISTPGVPYLCYFERPGRGYLYVAVDGSFYESGCEQNKVEMQEAEITNQTMLGVGGITFIRYALTVGYCTVPVHMVHCTDNLKIKLARTTHGSYVPRGTPIETIHTTPDADLYQVDGVLLSQDREILTTDAVSMRLIRIDATIDAPSLVHSSTAPIRPGSAPLLSFVESQKYYNAHTLPSLNTVGKLSIGGDPVGHPSLIRIGEILGGDVVIQNFPVLRSIEAANLSRLYLCNLPNLRHLTSDIYANRIVINNCPALKRIPSNFLKNTAFTSLTIEDLPALESIGANFASDYVRYHPCSMIASYLKDFGFKAIKPGAPRPEFFVFECGMAVNDFSTPMPTNRVVYAISKEEIWRLYETTGTFGIANTATGTMGIVNRQYTTRAPEITLGPLPNLTSVGAGFLRHTWGDIRIAPMLALKEAAGTFFADCLNLPAPL